MLFRNWKVERWAGLDYSGSCRLQYEFWSVVIALVNHNDLELGEGDSSLSKVHSN